MATTKSSNGMDSIGKPSTVGAAASPAAEQLGESPLTGSEAGGRTGSSPKESKRLTRGRITVRRFLRNRTAVVGAIGFIAVACMAVFGNRIGQWGYTDVDSTSFLTPPGPSHWFGTTQGGRDVFALVVEGTRKSMLIGVCVALLQTGIAAVIGSSAAYFGGWWERIALWFTDMLLVVPSFLIEPFSSGLGVVG